MPAKKYIVRLTDEERSYLTNLVSKGKAAAHKIKHANILLQADVNRAACNDAEIAKTFSCHCTTVEKIRKRLVTQGLEAALERKKRQTPPRQPVLDGDAEAHLMRIACGKAPDGRSKWTMQLLADRLVELEIVPAVSDETVRQTLKKMNSNHICANAG